LLAACQSSGLSLDRTRERIRTLREHDFLRDDSNNPPLAQLVKPTGYATFMVNVSQQCNLVCPYCYVNQGLFDYERKPIARMSAKTFTGLVKHIYRRFPHIDSYGYHFYGKALELNPSYDAVWFSKGSALSNMDKHQEAIACFDKALEIDPKDVLAWYSKGIAEDKLNRTQEAIISYKQFLELASERQVKLIAHARNRIEELSK